MNYNYNNQQPKEGNTLAIVGFILSFFIPIVPLILCIMGYQKSKETGTGRGLSIAGIIISCLPAVAILIIVIISLLFSTIMWPGMKKDIVRSAYCSQAYNCVDDGNGAYTCLYMDADGNENTVTCSNPDED